MPSGLLELSSQAHGQRPSAQITRSQLAVQDNLNTEDGEVEDFSGAWLLRVTAVVILVVGTKGMTEYASVDAETCPHGPSILSFWTVLAYLGESWLILDVVACAFLLRIMWLGSHGGILSRAFTCSSWGFAVFGLSQYSMQLSDSQQCWGLLSVLTMIGLMFAVLLPIVWCLIVDCDNMCTSCGEAGHDACLDGFEVLEWPEAIEQQTQECGDLELAVWRPRSQTRANRIAHPSAEVMGRSFESLALEQTQQRITVMRDADVLHDATTRTSVNMWASRHLTDRRGISIEDNAPERPKYISGIGTPEAFASPPSSNGDSNPPSPQLSTPRWKTEEDGSQV